MIDELKDYHEAFSFLSQEYMKIWTYFSGYIWAKTASNELKNILFLETLNKKHFLHLCTVHCTGGTAAQDVFSADIQRFSTVLTCFI
jgi:DNA-binding ferritin-like protein (Dps family)